MSGHEHTKFWMVWSPQGRAPTFKHTSKDSADTEAARLAKLNPGNQFFVLKAVGGWQTDIPLIKPIVVRGKNTCTDDGIPF